MISKHRPLSGREFRTWLRHKPIFFPSCLCLGVVCIAIVLAAGCQPPADVVGRSEVAEYAPKLADVPDSEYQFSPGMMIECDGKPISVESPGYACPTISDVDGDGADDLVVGQFNGGKMQFYRNVAGADEIPQYATRQWINSGKEPAQVPGVS